ncbi:MAG: nucleotidyltransferase domain-containing protein [Candidatus Bipolaricaulota bacterium]|nr:nucleotidyltransferase domain-containing protein [Candidatus Bipolaricaulota bacterium]
MLKKGYQRAIERFLRQLRREIRVQGALLFGSWAKDEAYPSSDLDLAVISEDFCGQHRIARRLFLSERWTSDVPADIVGLTPQELCAAQSLFVREILTHGQVLFDSGCIAEAQKKLKASRRL